MATILVPLDGSPLAEHALGMARLMASTLSAEVRLLHVLTEDERYSPAIERESLRALETRGNTAVVQSAPQLVAQRQQAELYLEKQAWLLRDAGLTVSVELGYGLPADTIIEVAHDCNVDLIIMATHGYSGLRRWALGSVTDKVVHAAQLPVLVVRGDGHGAPELRRIVVPLDGSETARLALPLAIDLVVKTRADLLLLTIIPPVIALDPSITPPTQTPEDLAALRDRLLNEVGGYSEQLNGINVTALVAEGFVAETICDEARSHNADLIVMSSHGYGGLRRWALGSVTDKVLHTATIPLLVTSAHRA